MASLCFHTLSGGVKLIDSEFTIKETEIKRNLKRFN